MARTCQIMNKQPMSGSNVSHAKNHTKRRFLPNLQKKRLWVPSEKRYITLRLSTKALRTIDKIGIEAALERMKKNAKKDKK